MSDKGYADRKRTTFEQAEGAEPLPTQLQLKELSKELRALLWLAFHSQLKSCRRTHDHSKPTISDPWRGILFDKHVFRDHKMSDEFTFTFEVHEKELKGIFERSDYLRVLGFVQWVLRHPKRPVNLDEQVAFCVQESRAAYAVFDGDTIIPVASESERQTLERAFADVAATEFNGARAHLRNAGAELTAGKYGASIRESIHAVESVARVLEPSANTLDPALGKLAKSVKIHPALRGGFGKLYGFTSDEEGIRHALLDEAVSAVDETDALYMLGSCASFVSYLINKARGAGLLQVEKK
jgi:hypothetical protein